MGRYHGLVIAEGLADPTILNDFPVRKVRITDDGMHIDYEGNRGRWHMYWVECNPEQVEAVRSQTKHGWYAHFWDDSDIVVVYDNRSFQIDRGDQSTWAEAIEHGKSQGIPEDELDFSVD